MTKTLQPLTDGPIRNHRHSSEEVTVHGCYRYLMAPVDLYQLIKQSFKKASRVGKRRRRQHAGNRGKVRGERGKDSVTYKQEPVHFSD